MQTIKLTIVIFIICLANTVFSQTKSKPVKILLLKNFVQMALQNHPTLKKIQHDTNEQIFQNKRKKAIQDLTLNLESFYEYTTALYNNNNKWGSKSKEFDFQAAIVKKFPHLLGMTSQLNLNFKALNGYNYSSSSSLDSYDPSIELQLTLPLLKNFLGKIDKSQLKEMKLYRKIIDLSKKEAIEAFILYLHLEYFTWLNLKEKKDIYEGFMKRSYQVYGQVIRKMKLKIADQVDVYLAQQNYLYYLNQFKESSTSYNNQTLKIFDLINNKNWVKKNQLIEPQNNSYHFQNQIMLKKSFSHSRLIDIAKTEIKRSSNLYSASKNDQLPNLDLILKAGRAGSHDDIDNSFKYFNQNNFYIGFQMSIPFENREKKNIKKAYKNQTYKMKKELIILQKEIILTKNQYYHKIKDRIRSFKVKNKMVNILKIRANLMQRKYLQGRVTLDQLTDARNLYANSRINLIDEYSSLHKLYYEYLALCDQLLK